MKKLFLTTVTMFAFSAAFAQDLTSKKGENYLPEAGEWAIGFNADGIFRYIGNTFNGNLNNNGPNLSYMSEGTFVGRKLITDKTAYRFLVNFRYQNSSLSMPADEIFPGEEIEEVTLVDYKVTNFSVALGVGKEWRRGKTRLQGFYGADALVTASANSTLTEATVEGEIHSYEIKYGPTFGISARGFLGAEYFLFPKIAIGAQYTWGVNVAFGGKVSYVVNGDEVFETNDNSSINIGDVGISSINLTLYF